MEFAADVEGVVCTLSGMSTLQQVEENCRSFADFDGLNDEQKSAIERAQKIMAESGTI